MGKMAMIIVLGMTLASAFLGYTMNRSNVDSVENMSAYFKYSTARNIAHSAVNIALHKRETDDSSTAFTGTIMRGSYTVTLVTTGDTLDLTSHGVFLDTSYTMVLRLLRYAKPFPTGNGGAPVSIAVDSVDYLMTGNTLIDGQEHDANGNLIPGSDTVLAVAVQSSYDSANVAAYSSHIIGEPDVAPMDGMSDPAAYVEEYIAMADYTYSAGTYGGNEVWGSAADPKIIVCDAGSGSVKFTGTREGWGVLVVKGTLTLAGTFTFHGLVIAYQDAGIDEDFTTEKGTPRIIGQLWVAGDPGGNFVMKGNAQVLRSSTAVYDAENMTKLSAYRILAWYE